MPAGPRETEESSGLFKVTRVTAVTHWGRTVGLLSLRLGLVFGFSGDNASKAF